MPLHSSRKPWGEEWLLCYLATLVPNKRIHLEKNCQKEILGDRYPTYHNKKKAAEETEQLFKRSSLLIMAKRQNHSASIGKCKLLAFMFSSSSPHGIDMLLKCKHSRTINIRTF